MCTATGCLLLLSICQAAAAPASNVMALEKAYPAQMGTALKAIRNNEKDLAAYLEDPDTVCTVFVPTNQAMSDWMRCVYRHDQHNPTCTPPSTATTLDHRTALKFFTTTTHSLYWTLTHFTQHSADCYRWFGKYAGKAVQNTTFMSSALNYHVILGQALTTSQIAKGGRQLTRANETVYFWKGPGWGDQE